MGEHSQADDERIVESALAARGATTCTVEDCSRAPRNTSGGMCAMHYFRQWRNGTTEARNNPAKLPCAVAGCDRISNCHSFCRMHYIRWKKTGDAGSPEPRSVPNGSYDGVDCAIADCDRPARRRGWCTMHNRRWERHGDPLAKLPSGRRPGATGRAGNGAGTLNAGGYRVIRRAGHPNAMRNGSILEHVVVMSEMLGRPLLRHENVHHMNGIRDDNRPENLELWTVPQLPGRRVSDLVAWVVDQYPDEVRAMLDHSVRLPA